MDLLVLWKSGQQDSIDCHQILRGSGSRVYKVGGLNRECGCGLSVDRSILRKFENTAVLIIVHRPLNVIAVDVAFVLIDGASLYFYYIFRNQIVFYITFAILFLQKFIHIINEQ